MTVAEGIPDVISFARFLGDICLVTAIVGCAFTITACVCILRFPLDNPTEPATLPPVTVLKAAARIRAGSPGASCCVLPAEL